MPFEVISTSDRTLPRMSLSCGQYGLVLKEALSFQVTNATCSWTNIALALPTTVINALLIIALLSAKESTKPCQILLMNLAVTDFLAGLLIMPSLFMVFRYIGEDKDPCHFAIFTSPAGYILGFTSILMISMIAMERYINVFHPFFHQAKLKPLNVMTASGLVWVLTTCLVMPSITLSDSVILVAATATVIVICTTINAFCYTRILLRARKVRVQIDAEAKRLGHVNGSTKDKRLVSIGLSIVISISVCYLPIATGSLLGLFQYGISTKEYITCWSWTLAMGNSLINPLITCTLHSEIKKRIYKMLTCKLREVGLQHSNTSH